MFVFCFQVIPLAANEMQNEVGFCGDGLITSDVPFVVDNNWKADVLDVGSDCKHTHGNTSGRAAEGGALHAKTRKLCCGY